MQNDEIIKFNEHRKLQELLVVTFRFAKQEAKPILKVLLVLVAPLVIIMGILLGSFQAEFSSLLNEPELITNYLEDFLLKVGLSSILIALVYYLLYALITTIAVSYILEYINNGPKVPLSNIIFQLKIFLPRVVLLTLVSSIITVVSYILIVPGVYFSIAFSLSIIVLVLEDSGIFTSLKRSVYFIKGYWWQTFGYFMVLMLISLAVSQLFSIPLHYINSLVADSAMGVSPDSTLMLILYIVASVISSIAFIFLVIVQIFLAFYYFSQYELKEVGTPTISNLEKTN